MIELTTRKTKRTLGNTKLLQVWVSEELYSTLDNIARLRNVTMAEAVRQLIAANAEQQKAA